MIDEDGNLLIVIDGVTHRHLGRFDGRHLLEAVGTGRIFLQQGSDRQLGLPEEADVEALVARGRATWIGSGTQPPTPCETDRLEVQIALLDGAGVRNGVKAIWIWLNANWTGDLIAAHGPHDHPATLKRLRTARSRARAK